MDFGKVCPKLVVSEHMHLIRHRYPELESLEKRLFAHGYWCAHDKENHWCVGGLDMAPEDFCQCFRFPGLDTVKHVVNECGTRCDASELQCTESIKGAMKKRQGGA